MRSSEISESSIGVPKFRRTRSITSSNSSLSFNTRLLELNILSAHMVFLVLLIICLKLFPLNSAADVGDFEERPDDAGVVERDKSLTWKDSDPLGLSKMI